MPRARRSPARRVQGLADRAYCHALLEQHDLAAADYASAIERAPSGDPELASLHRWRAQSLDLLGRSAEAALERDAAEHLDRR